MSIVVKCLGAAAIVGGAYVMGNCFNKELKEKEEFASALEQGLRFLEGRIAITEKMLCEVMRETGEKVFKGRENVFSSFADKLSEGQEISAAWQCAVKEMFYLGGGVPEKERECLLKLEHSFTLGDVERYSEGFVQVAEDMKAICAEAESKRKKEGSAAVKICLCGALAAVLVIW